MQVSSTSAERGTRLTPISIDLSHELKEFLAEEYFDDETPDDGEIYRRIRRYQWSGDPSFESHWWGYLSPHRKRNVKQLFRHHELTAAFDALLDLPGLWGGMMISTLHSMLSTHCDEASRTPI